MTHNGIDIDQYVLFTIYPFAAFMVSGLVARKTKMAEVTKYIIQAAICIAFSIVYFVAVPNGGAQGLAIVWQCLARYCFLWQGNTRSTRSLKKTSRVAQEPRFGLEGSGRRRRIRRRSRRRVEQPVCVLYSAFHKAIDPVVKLFLCGFEGGLVLEHILLYKLDLHP